METENNKSKDLSCDWCGKDVLPEYRRTWADLVLCCESCKVQAKEKYLND